MSINFWHQWFQQSPCSIQQILNSQILKMIPSWHWWNRLGWGWSGRTLKIRDWSFNTSKSCNKNHSYGVLLARFSGIEIVVRMKPHNCINSKKLAGYDMNQELWIWIQIYQWFTHYSRIIRTKTFGRNLRMIGIWRDPKWI